MVLRDMHLLDVVLMNNSIHFVIEQLKDDHDNLVATPIS